MGGCVPTQIPHLQELGINAVELLPVLEYDELEFQRTPNPRDHMVNIWGYSHISFLAPMSRWAPNIAQFCSFTNVICCRTSVDEPAGLPISWGVTQVSSCVHHAVEGSVIGELLGM